MDPKQAAHLKDLSKLIRYWILTSTTRAGSGHPTSSLSAVELMSALFFGNVLRYDPAHPQNPNNDRVIFSKGHASPLLYSLWAAAGEVSDQELMTYRTFGSPLEGHPTSHFRFAEAATGSLGQGLSIGVGMALNARYLDHLPYRTYVLLGDSEMAEGSQWEAMQLAAHYKLDNLVGVLDVNRLGQRGETMYGHDLNAYRDRVASFGWEVIILDDGHDLDAVQAAYERARQTTGRPSMLVARTIKGKGVSFLEDADGWHGKTLDDEQLQAALKELEPVDRTARGRIALPEKLSPPSPAVRPAGPLEYKADEKVATRKAYGNALKRLGCQYPHLVSLDGEVSNSTFAELFRDAYGDRFFEMYIAEQNMVGAALGLALRGKCPFVSTFAAFLSRAFDQIRMSRHSDANLKFVGSHAGVSIGQDGPSQMGLEDIAMFRTVPDSVVVYPCDAVSTERLVEALIEHRGVSYLRATREKTPIIYETSDDFHIGGCKVLRQSNHDEATIVAAGITLHEALKAHDRLEQDGVQVRVIDLYSIKPLDVEVLRQAAEATRLVVTVEDHYPQGGLGEAVRSALEETSAHIHCLAVDRHPKSGKPEELLNYEHISAEAIADCVTSLAAAHAHGHSPWI